MFGLFGMNRKKYVFCREVCFVLFEPEFKSGRVRASVCENVSGRFRACIQNFFITFRVTIFSSLAYICYTHRGYFWEWSDCDFSPANSICKHSCVLLFSVRIRLTLFLRRQQPKEISTQCHCVEEISHIRDSWLFFKKQWPTNRLFMPKGLSHIVSFMPIAPLWIISLLLEKHCIPQFYRWLSS